MLSQLIAACLGTISFSLIFHVNKRYYPVCGAIGGVGWVVYLLLQNQISSAAASFLATCFVAFASRACAIYKRCPVTVFLIAGILPLVPGAGVYWSAYYLIMNETAQFNQVGLDTVKEAFAIVLGIVFVFEIPQGFFRKIFGMSLKTDDILKKRTEKKRN